ncbi:MAG: 50S ribosomal protein L9 [Bacteroidetes bacterium]|jgi:large subunit ribosomal protein L9|nr:50S ribosomal protein L9 [Bacteroidota bacterium]
MKIILTQDVKNLGHKDDVVVVKDGYGRNYLIPKGMAKLATDGAMKMLAEDIRQRAFKVEKLRKDAEQISAKLNGASVTVKTKAGASGKIFGSVTGLQIANALKEQGYEVDRRKIAVDDIKNLGTYTADINLFKDITASITVEVVAE